MNIVIPAVAIVSIVVLAWLGFRFYFSRAKQILERWAQENSYEIKSAEFRWFFRGKFCWTTNDQAVYYITIRTRDGQAKCGWVRCGGWLLGILSNQADVRWDD